MTKLDQFLDAATALGKKVERKRPNEAQIQCPAHEDRNPSLHVTHDGEKVLFKCHAGCSQEAVLDALGLTLSDLYDGEPKQRQIVAEYNYHDEEGNPLFQVVRYEPKDFRQRHKPPGGDWVWNLQNVRRVLYRLPDLADANVVYLVEGEKDADRLADIGVAATTVPGGAKKWRDEYTDSLQGKRVVIVADADDVGLEHAAIVSEALGRAGIEHKVKQAAQGKDVSDHLNAGLTLTDLVTVQVSGLGLLSESATHEDFGYMFGQGTKALFEARFRDVYKERGAVWTQISLHRVVGGKVDERAVIGPDRLNLLRGDRGGFDGFVEKVSNRYTQWDWEPLFQEAKRSVLSGLDHQLERKVLDMPIGDMYGEPYLSHPYLSGSGTTVLYGDGGTGKSIMALALALELASGVSIVSTRVPQGGGIASLYLDWEDSHDVLYNRAAALASSHSVIPTALGYMHRVRMENILAHDVRELLPIITEKNIGLVIVDSLGQACGGDINTAEAVIRLTNAIRKLGVPVLGIHHNNKTGLPYGSVYIRNHARLMWHVQGRAAPPGDPLTYMFVEHTKHSHVPKQPTQYLSQKWVNDEIYIPQKIRYERVDVHDFPEADEAPMATPITTEEVCLSFLRLSAGEKFTYLQVWELAPFLGEIPAESVKRRLNDLVKDGLVQKQDTRPVKYWVEEDYDLPDPY